MPPLILLALMTLASQPAPPELLLACDGVGNQRDRQTATLNPFTSDQRRIELESSQRVGAQVTVQISSSGNRIRLPANLLPPIRGSSDNGWRDLSDVVVGDDAITARFSLNLLNRPSVVIDRRTGSIEIDGFADTAFSGECTALDPDQRRF